MTAMKASFRRRLAALLVGLAVVGLSLTAAAAAPDHGKRRQRLVRYKRKPVRRLRNAPVMRQ
jgi:hypothetical protein